MSTNMTTNSQILPFYIRMCKKVMHLTWCCVCVCLELRTGSWEPIVTMNRAVHHCKGMSYPKMVSRVRRKSCDDRARYGDVIHEYRSRNGVEQRRAFFPVSNAVGDERTTWRRRRRPRDVEAGARRVYNSHRTRRRGNFIINHTTDTHRSSS